MMTSPLAEEKIWFNKHIYEEAERQYYESKATLPLSEMPKETQKTDKKAPKQGPTIPVKETVVTAQDALPPSPPLTPKKSTPQPAKGKDAKDMKNEADKEGMKKKKKKDKSKKKSVEEVVEKTNMDGVAIAATNPSSDILNRLAALEFVNSDLTKVIEGLRSKISTLELRLKNLENKPASPSTPSAAPSASKPTTNAAPAPKPAKKEEDDDDGVDLFGSDSEEEDEAAKKVREQRLAEYAAKKSKKPVLIAKSNIILDVKPWDDETDMAEMEKKVRSIDMDGLVWGASKLVPLAFGIKKLQISCVVEDDKVSVDLLQETIQEHEDYVQSVDIAAFNKV